MELWGVAVPTWLSAVGTVGASVVALIALITSRRNRSGIDQIKIAQNEQETPTPSTVSVPPPDLSAIDDGNGGLPPEELEAASDGEGTDGEGSGSPDNPEADDDFVLPKGFTLIMPQPARWTVVEKSRHRHLLRHNLDADVVLRGFEQIDGGHDVHLPLELPIEVGPGVDVPFSVERRLTSPTVIAVKLTWTQSTDSREFTRTLYI